MSVDMNELARSVAEELQGTCSNLTIVLEDRGAEGADNDSDFCATLDSLVFCCDTCGWWCEMSEMSENSDWVCDQCDDSEEED